MKKGDVIAFLIIIGVLIVFIFLMYSFMRAPGELDTLSITSGERVGVLEIEGVIFDSRPFTDDLRKFLNNSSVKAVVIRINSPGGGVAASQEMYTAIKRAAEKIPLVVSMASVAASGGYYAALAADSIIANPGTTTGSIGVLAQIPHFYQLMDKIGVGQEVIKSGKFKDTGNPYRQMTAAEKKYLQEWVDDTYEQFIETVAEERGMELDKVKAVADGRVFTGRQALKIGLIDRLGDFRDAVKIAGEMGGIKGEPQILEKKKRALSLFDIVFGDFEEALNRLTSDKVQLMYIMP